MDLSRILVNWRTSVAGLAVIAMGFVESFVFDVPGWSVGFAESFPIAIGLILAKDAVTGSAP